MYNCIIIVWLYMYTEGISDVFSVGTYEFKLQNLAAYGKVFYSDYDPAIFEADRFALQVEFRPVYPERIFIKTVDVPENFMFEFCTRTFEE